MISSLNWTIFTFLFSFIWMLPFYYLFYCTSLSLFFLNIIIALFLWWNCLDGCCSGLIIWDCYSFLSLKFWVVYTFIFWFTPCQFLIEFCMDFGYFCFDSDWLPVWILRYVGTFTLFLLYLSIIEELFSYYGINCKF